VFRSFVNRSGAWSVTWGVAAVILALVVASHAFRGRRSGEATFTPTVSGPIAMLEKPSLPFLPKPTPPSPKELAVRQLRKMGLEPTRGALAQVVRRGGIEAMELFFQAGFSPDTGTPQGEPILLLACETGQVASVNLLLAAGADPNATAGRTGVTPVLATAARGDRLMLEQLARAGADLQHRDRRGHNALHYAMAAVQRKTVDWLLERQVAIEGPCCDGTETLLSHTLKGHDLFFIRQLLGALKPHDWSDAAREALLDGVRHRDEPLVRLLLENHGAPPTPHGARQPLLGYAIGWGQTDVLRLLLECGADPNTPLESPVEKKFAELIPSETVRYYLQKEEGMTPLMLAAGLGRREAVELLLEHGAKRGTVTKKWRMAALSLAARGKHTPVIQLLLGKRPEQQQTRIDISLDSQRATLWREGEPVLSTRISTGRKGYATPRGEFVITDKHRSRVSTIYKVKMPYFMRLNCSDIGMHAGAVPGYPASHGCIRLPREVAIRFFKEVEAGTVVTIR